MYDFLFPRLPALRSAFAYVVSFWFPALLLTLLAGQPIVTFISRPFVGLPCAPQGRQGRRSERAATELGYVLPQRRWTSGGDGVAVPHAAPPRGEGMRMWSFSPSSSVEVVFGILSWSRARIRR